MMTTNNASDYLSTLMDPFNNVSQIPDETSVPSTLKTIKSVHRLTTTGNNELFLFCPGNVVAPLWRGVEVAGFWRFYEVLAPSETIASNYELQRLVSAGMTVSCNTVPGGGFDLQGEFSATTFHSWPYFGAMTVSEILSINTNSESIMNVPMREGLVALYHPHSLPKFLPPPTTTCSHDRSDRVVSYLTDTVSGASSSYAKSDITGNDVDGNPYAAGARWNCSKQTVNYHTGWIRVDLEFLSEDGTGVEQSDIEEPTVQFWGYTAGASVLIDELPLSFTGGQHAVTTPKAIQVYGSVRYLATFPIYWVKVGFSFTGGSLVAASHSRGFCRCTYTQEAYWAPNRMLPASLISLDGAAAGYTLTITTAYNYEAVPDHELAKDLESMSYLPYDPAALSLAMSCASKLPSIMPYREYLSLKPQMPLTDTDELVGFAMDTNHIGRTIKKGMKWLYRFVKKDPTSRRVVSKTLGAFNPLLGTVANEAMRYVGFAGDSTGVINPTTTGLVGYSATDPPAKAAVVYEHNLTSSIVPPIELSWPRHRLTITEGPDSPLIHVDEKEVLIQAEWAVGLREVRNGLTFIGGAIGYAATEEVHDNERRPFVRDYHVPDLQHQVTISWLDNSISLIPGVSEQGSLVPTDSFYPRYRVPKNHLIGFSIVTPECKIESGLIGYCSSSSESMSLDPSVSSSVLSEPVILPDHRKSVDEITAKLKKLRLNPFVPLTFSKMESYQFFPILSNDGGALGVVAKTKIPFATVFSQDDELMYYRTRGGRLYACDPNNGSATVIFPRLLDYYKADPRFYYTMMILRTGFAELRDTSFAAATFAATIGAPCISAITGAVDRDFQFVRMDRDVILAKGAYLKKIEMPLIVIDPQIHSVEAIQIYVRIPHPVGVEAAIRMIKDGYLLQWWRQRYEAVTGQAIEEEEVARVPVPHRNPEGSTQRVRREAKTVVPPDEVVRTWPEQKEVLLLVGELEEALRQVRAEKKREALQGMVNKLNTLLEKPLVEITERVPGIKPGTLENMRTQMQNLMAPAKKKRFVGKKASELPQGDIMDLLEGLG